MMNTSIVGLRKVLGDVCPITAICVQRQYTWKIHSSTFPIPGARWSSFAMTLTSRVGERR